MGVYLMRVLDPDVEGGVGVLEKIFGPIERLIYKVGRVDRKKQQNWKSYAMSLLIFSLVGTLFSYGLLSRAGHHAAEAEHGQSVDVTVGTRQRCHQRRRESSGDHRLYPGRQLPDQYRLAKLRAGADVHVLLADRRDGDSVLLLLGNRDCGGGGDGARNRAQANARHRQLLDRSDAHHALPVPAHLHRLQRALGLAGHADELQRLHRRPTRWTNPRRRRPRSRRFSKSRKGRWLLSTPPKCSA